MGIKFHLTNKMEKKTREGWIRCDGMFKYRDLKTNKIRTRHQNLCYHNKYSAKIYPTKLEICINYMISKGMINEEILNKFAPFQLRRVIQDFCKKVDDIDEIAVDEDAEGDSVKITSGFRLFEPNEDDSDGGRTSLIGGSSFTGKTYFLVNEINKLRRDEYDCILVMTESRNAKDLKTINEDLHLQIVEGYRPDLINKLKRINDKCENRYRFLIIMDDIVDQKNSSTLLKSILTYRNANISTCILIQYLKLIPKAARGSFHQVVLTGFRSLEDYQVTCEMFDLCGFVREKLSKERDVPISHVKKYDVYQYLKELMKSKDIKIYLDQQHSKDPEILRS